VAFKLSKQELADRDGHVEKLEKAWAELVGTVSTYNLEVEAIRVPVEKAVADYNEALGGAKEFAEHVATRLEGEYDEKSEKWRDGDKGQAAAELKDAWQEIDTEEINLEWPEDLSIDDPDHAPELAELPTEAE
jgi:predicted  nucleic acid-binding Zn-ribbon protein